MSESGPAVAVSGSELRQRLPQQPDVPQQAASVESAKQTVLDLNAQEARKDDDKEKRTFGRTPNGTVFTVPETHDMVSQLFSPSEPKNLGDVVVILILSALIAALFVLPKPLRQPYFAIVFLFWRACYNGGIGYLLYQQSNNNALVEWARKYKIFQNPATGKNPRPVVYKVLKREMETKIPKDYKFDEAPIEYNTWLLFRRGVDLILMCDFTSYCCFAAACGGTPPGENVLVTVSRWVVGIGLILFNLWVKLDAHRVVKDFAWYWGDFFYLIDQELTFDGVFEMAPHPMYSVGYAGFYGISLMAASYKVLFISIVAHAAQFAFLALVENPHIDKTYNPPPPRKRVPDAPANVKDYTDSPRELDASVESISPILSPLSPTVTAVQPPVTRDMLGIDNIDFHRVTDVATILLQVHLYLLAICTPSTPFYRALFVINAVVWRLWYSLGIGFVLTCQSESKSWTRHFIKYGETTEEAWRQWKGIYHLSMSMCYASFVMAAMKMYSLPPDWTYGMALLRHVVGVALIVLHLWTVWSIYESLGEFGWFFGDFFYEDGPKLTYGGIYRFLNNPERVIGLAGVWGFAIITWSKAVFFLALLSHTLTLAFIQFVERPHMQKRYGQSMRERSGVSKTFHRSLPQPLKAWEGSVDRVLTETVEYMGGFIGSVRPQLSAGVDSIKKDTKALLRRYPARLSISKVPPDEAGFHPKEYSIEFEGTPVPNQSAVDKASGREGEIAQTTFSLGNDFRPVVLQYGCPIRVKWSAPLHHGKKDWIGLYMIADNTSKEITRISSQGRWIATTKGAYDYARDEQGIVQSDKQTIDWDNDKGHPRMTGEMEFAGDKLWWTTGVFEFRYHHDGHHNVMAISKPFEIKIGRFSEADVEADPSGSLRGAIESALLPVVRNCFDRDPDIAPNTVDEGFGGLVERDGKFANRVVFAVWQMFGIEFAADVVKADGNVKNLAWRISSAKQVLSSQAPYSMEARAPDTPVDEKQ